MKWFFTWSLLINIVLLITIDKTEAISWWFLIVVFVFSFCFYRSIFCKWNLSKLVLVILVTTIILGHWQTIDYPSRTVSKKIIKPYSLKVQNIYSNFYIVSNKSGKKWYLSRFYYQKQKIRHLTLNLDDEIKFCGQIRTLTNPEIKKWLWRNAQTEDELRIISKNNCFVKIKRSQNLINKLKNYLQQTHNSKTWKWIQFLLFQETDREFLPIKKQINALGVMHLFVISGFHLLIWTKWWFWCAKKQKRKWIKTLLEISGLISCGFLVYLTHWKISALKSFLFLLTIWIGRKINYKENNPKEIIAFIGLLFLAWEPQAFWKISFQLSFIASWLLVKKDHKIRKKTNYLNQIISKNLLITIFVLPIIVQLNYQIPVLATFYTFFFGLLMIIFYPLFFVTIWIPLFSLWWVYLLSFLTRILYWSQKINIVFPIVWNKEIWIGIYYSKIIIFYALYQNYGHGKEVFLLIMWSMTFLLINFFQIRTEKYHLHMINVGHGLAMLLHNPEKTTNILLDAGSGKRKENNSQKIVQYLKKHNIHHLNAVFLSHRHTDHYNNFLQISNNIFIESIWTNEKQQKHYQIQEIIFKNWAYSYYQTMKKENNQGLVLETEINGYRLFFPFDLEKTGEQKLLSSQTLTSIDILQVAHHGSLSSSHLNFLKAAKPKYCLVSAKKISSKTKEKFKKSKCFTWVTGQVGNILVKIGKNIIIKTQK